MDHVNALTKKISHEGFLLREGHALVISAIMGNNVFLNALELFSKIYTRSRRSTFGLVSIQHDRRKHVDKSRAAIGLRTKKCDKSECFVDGSANSEGKAGFAVYYADGHELNLSSALSVDGNGRNNVAEIAACYAAVWRHPRDQPLVVYTDSFKALRCIEEFRDSEILPDVPAPGPSLVAAIGVALQLRTAPTSLVKIPAHCRLEKHDLADNLAKAARDSDHQTISMPPLRPFLFNLGLAYLEERGRSKTERNSPLLASRSRSTSKKSAVAVDCEMIEPKSKMHRTSTLASVSLVNESGKQIYFSFVRRSPKHVKNYRTRISGVKPEHLSRKHPKSDDFGNVQKKVRELIKDKVLVGHDLAHDLSALGLEHPPLLVRDTSILFMKQGEKNKPGLKTLAKEQLGLTIQRRGRAHDPQEDARTAMSLYLLCREQFDDAVESGSVNGKRPAAQTVEKQPAAQKPQYVFVDEVTTSSMYQQRRLEVSVPRL